MPSDDVPPRLPTPPSRPSVSLPARTHPRAGARLGPNFMTYPYPDAERVLAHLKTLPNVKDETNLCITNLLHYRALRMRARFPRKQSAAVLVPLFIGRSGDLHVVLSRRSDTLRAFAGDTALPGGKMDPQDPTVEDTARREAFEEIGLPQDKQRLPLLCVMEPFLAKGEMLVTPVIVLIADYSLEPNLNSSEVTSIFAQPLVSFLSSKPQLSSGRTMDSESPFYTFTDLPSGEGTTYRMHSFRTGREAEGVKPVTGLTAWILIKTASIGYGRTPDFAVQPHETRTLEERIAYALLTSTNPLRKACLQEGIDVSKTIARLMRPSIAANATRTIEWTKIGAQWKRLMEGDRSAQKEQNGEEAERRGASPNLAALGEFLDEMQDVVNERMEELKNDEKKLAKAREAYPKIMEQVKKEIEKARSEGGNLDPKVLFSFISKEGDDGLQDGNGRKSQISEGKDNSEPVAKRRNAKL